MFSFPTARTRSLSRTTQMRKSKLHVTSMIICGRARRARRAIYGHVQSTLLQAWTVAAPPEGPQKVRLTPILLLRCRDARVDRTAIVGHYNPGEKKRGVLSLVWWVGRGGGGGPGSYYYSSLGAEFILSYYHSLHTGPQGAWSA